MPDTGMPWPNNLVIRFAQPDDVPTLFSLINALAEYEQLSHCVTGSADALAIHLFGDRPCIEAIVATCEDRAVGFALFFTNYSTFLTKPGLYLEDLFVLPDYRSQGIGKALLRYIAQLALQRDYGRIEWSVLDWNAPAIGFYQRMGATVLPDWRICRVTGKAIGQLAMRE
ncbi:GNAT family N-acetyltransferase [Thermocoleostomius sinensis]|jgi:GNAT superfamily N-acetyltransferase|uniref:GNAT family N-acetyltransferase n=1 Tax=Thermocoleostomius sinensis A174 TaxID=2016057 RepID=A0A9E8ZI13_9CYAN|nr:GNAT family N-acetyltransferase [Thermocoleostomius sinensis]WAL61590.1 GNAT family N-acetyltransferase [Thermocoleostomius sinensis A174]